MDYGEALREIAEADPESVTFLDIWAPYYAAGVPGTDSYALMQADKIHRRDAG